jgi:hypothetical protein
MPQTATNILATLFESGTAEGFPLEFRWHLIKRRGQPFLLLPADANGKVGLELYSAQRPLAKVLKAFLPVILQTPAKALLPQVVIRTGTESSFVRFLSEQSGVPAGELQAPAIRFGGLTENKLRLILLQCDQTRRPASVIKAGIDAGGREVIRRERQLLARLPGQAIGCIRTSGELETDRFSAFATPFHPGLSPANDAGLEVLFHSWLNAKNVVPIESFDSWKTLDQIVARAEPERWRQLRAALAGHQVRSSLHHGDFAPWNIRAINARNLQAFDWEFGQLEGMPGWDWFHFFVQTCILGKRHSAERVAAEVEDLLASPRFEKYAAAAGITTIAKPLLLAYLLHQHHVIKPVDGRAMSAPLFNLLAARWGYGPTAVARPSAPKPALALWTDAVQQLKSAAIQVTNLFWEPCLASKTMPTMAAQFFTGWPYLLAALLMAGMVAGAQLATSANLTFLPFYLVPMTLVTLRLDRRWGAVIATVAAVLGPLVQSHKDAAFDRVEVLLWNIMMRFIMLQMCVFFVDRIYRQKNILTSPLDLRPRPAKFAENWAVIAACLLAFAAIFTMDYVTNPHWNFIPVYLIPCMVLTLRLNLKWGLLAAALASLAGSLSEFLTNPGYKPQEVFGWNCTMRFVISAVVIVLVERIRQESVLFYTSDHQAAGQKSAQ